MRTTVDTRELTPFRIGSLYPPVDLKVDLYLSATREQAPCLYSASGLRPGSKDLDRLAERGVQTLWIPGDQAETLRATLRELAESAENLEPAFRLEIAREAVRDEFLRAWRSHNPDDLVARAAGFSQTVVDVCRSQEAMTAVLASLIAHDADTFAHVSNVCTYSIMLARAAGMEDEDELLRVGQAGLLHDIGKRSIETGILKKPGRLTPGERTVIANHPRLGFEELCHRPDLTRDQLLTVYQHHEKLDGSGYPVGITGTDINWLARLCAVVDAFDALTARRVYRQSAAPEDALKLLRQGAGKDFCPEYVECWAHLVDRAMGDLV